MLAVIIISLLLVSGIVAFKLSKKSKSQEKPIESDEYAPESTPPPTIMAEIVATEEQKTTRKANAAKQATAKKTTAKKAAPKKAAKKTTKK